MDISVEQPWSMLEVLTLSFLPLLLIVLTGIIIETIVPSDVAKIGLLLMWVGSIIGSLMYGVLRKKHKINIHINDQNLFIERRPRKFIQDKVYAARDVDQVYIKSVSSSATGKKGFGVFMLFNGINGQKHIELIKFVSSRSKAKYIEQEIENHLGIPDRRVPDEE